MLNELNALETRIAQVVALCSALRAENAGLREELAATQAERQHLVERMRAASTRLEQLAQQISETQA